MDGIPRGEYMMNKRTRIIVSLGSLGIIALLLVLRSLGGTRISPDAAIEISLQRTPCFGSCPVYSVSVDGDGNVHYFGEYFVPVLGDQSSRISRETVLQLIHAFERVDFFSLDTYYTNMNATDMPSAIVTLSVDGVTKYVEHYYGDLSAPVKLTDLEAEIDRLLNTAQWTAAQ